MHLFLKELKAQQISIFRTAVQSCQLHALILSACNVYPLIRILMLASFNIYFEALDRTWASVSAYARLR